MPLLHQFMISVYIIGITLCSAHLVCTRAADESQLTQRLTWNTLIAINFFNRD